MQTIEEVREMLGALEQKEGKQAATAWVAENAKDLPEDVRDQVIFDYSTDAFIEQTKGLGHVTAFVQDGLSTLDRLEADRRAIEGELKTRDVKDRLNMGGEAA